MKLQCLESFHLDGILSLKIKITIKFLSFWRKFKKNSRNYFTCKSFHFDGFFTENWNKIFVTLSNQFDEFYWPKTPTKIFVKMFTFILTIFLPHQWQHCKQKVQKSVQLTPFFLFCSKLKIWQIHSTKSTKQNNVGSLLSVTFLR